jgi:hypothetical protein
MTFLDEFKGFFRKKTKLRAVFFDETGSEFTKNVIVENNRFEISENLFGKKGVYIADHNYIVYERKKRIPKSYYYVNNPNPIHIQHQRNREMDSIGFKRILDSKVIEELFSNSGIKFLTIILVVVCAILVLNFAIGYGAYKASTGITELKNITMTLCG